MFTLFTRDGTKTGNAIIVCYDEGCDNYLIETDFGNTMKLNRKEIDELFTLGRPQDYDTWREDRYKLHIANVSNVLKAQTA